MPHSRLLLLALAFTALGNFGLPAQEKKNDAKPFAQDKRYEKPKDYNGYFPWTPPSSKASWDSRRQVLREQVLVAVGLWPMPEKTPLSPVIHGKIQRDGYTVEKVFFASYPGHYVSGNLYRPTGKSGKLPAILSPHGHWANGRFFEAKDKEIEAQLKNGAEKTREGAKYPLQARCAQLARMGCVVFHYDMVGRADSQKIGHTAGFLDADAELRLQNFMGLQTYNSIRALDFLSSLPDVDPERIGVTGASGGGTQTFMLCAVDDRPAAAFPAVMVSIGMQGGCICENCSYLRIGTGNIELAGLFAPKPLGMSAANDWTKEIMTKGLPQLKDLYKLLGADNNVMAEAHLEFGHNYNQVSREIMYNFFNKHLKLGLAEPIKEQPFVPVPPKELSVYDAEHPVPKDALGAAELRKAMTAASDKQMDALVPKDAKSLAEFRRVFGGALRAMIEDSLPKIDQVEEVAKSKPERKAGLRTKQFVASRKGAGEAVRMELVAGENLDFNGTLVIWVHPDGLDSLWTGGKLTPAAQKIIDQKAVILAVEVFGTGPGAGKTAPVNKAYAGYTFGYNRPIVALRVHDILTAVALAQDLPSARKNIYIIGFEQAGPWVALARCLCGDAVKRTACDMNQFRCESVKSMDDEMMLPGALKYGGLPAFTALVAPHQILMHNSHGADAGKWLEACYQLTGKTEALRKQQEKRSPQEAIDWLLRP